MDVEIRDGVPLPAARKKRVTIDFKKMKVGQSFLVRNVDLNGVRYAAKVQDTKIAVRREDDEHMCVWKTG